MAQNETKEPEHGAGIVELLATVSFISMLLVLAAANLQALNKSSQNGAMQLSSFLKTARSKAISTTSAYRVKPASSTTIITRYGADCEETTPTYIDSQLTLELPDGALLNSETWEVCYTPRGISRDNVTINLFDVDNRSKSVEVLLGGAVRIHDAR